MMKFVDLEKQYLLYKKEIDTQVAEVLSTTSFILGPKVGELEEKLAGFVGVRHAVALSSGTDALLVALMAVGVGPGDEVITSPFSFFATAEVVMLLGARPVFADIDPATFNLDPAGLDGAFTPRTRAVMPVSLYGQCADFERINDWAARRSLPVIEDGCQSFGARRHGKRSCGLSTVGCTSFFPSKPLGGYGDGGMLFTDDDGCAAAARRILNHGQDRRYHHARLGLNARLDTVQAAVLLAKLPHFEEELRLRGEVGRAYGRLLGGLPGLSLPAAAPGNTHVWAQYTVETDDRDALAEALRRDGIPTAVHYPAPIHLQPACAGLGLPEGSFPLAERAAARVVSLPMHPFLTREETGRVAAAVREYLAG